MDTLTFWHTPHGADRLLQMMIDTGNHIELARHDKPRAAASSAHKRLFDGYVPLLRKGYEEAIDWWDGTVRAVSDTGDITEDALEESFDRRMAGPAADPKIVWIVRMVWFECCRINDVDRSVALRPEYLMVQWLKDAGEEDLVRLLSCMPYWPIGLDENGNWC